MVFESASCGVMKDARFNAAITHSYMHNVDADLQPGEKMSCIMTHSRHTHTPVLEIIPIHLPNAF